MERKAAGGGSERALTLGLALLALVPIWGFERLATQDGPSHLYNTHILIAWDDEGSVFPSRYERDLAPIPNWLGTALLYPLMLAAPPATADRILASLGILAMAAAWRWWLSGFAPRPGPLAAAGGLLSCGFFLFKGLYSFWLSVPLLLATLGLAWRIRGQVTVPRAALLNLLLGAVFLGHAVTFGVALLAVSAILAFAPAAGRPPGARAARAAWAAPAWLLAADLAARAGGAETSRWGAWRVTLYLARGEWLVFGPPAQLAVSCGLMALLALLGLRAAAARKPGSLPAGTVASLVVPAGAIVILCYLLPRGLDGGSFLTDRLAVFP
ncbi:MAG TPA: hypothetical protein VJV23_07495, partial [Candidatus Polarisedimenticolia bacterium]|nr:hypothetical protein [Candidatus Polarisedimenticolia bacterium]